MRPAEGDTSHRPAALRQAAAIAGGDGVSRIVPTSLLSHTVASLFPMMSEAELLDLAGDIAENGLRESIWLHPDGSILDGRNRYLACQKAGVEPTFRTWDGQGSAVSGLEAGA